MASSRTQRKAPAPDQASATSENESPGAKASVQLKASLRGQDFAAQEALLAPGADLGGGVISGEPPERAAQAPAPGVQKKQPVQAKGLMSNLRSGGWKVSGNMPQYELADGWHGSVFATGANGPNSEGLFFDGFHLTWGAAPQGSAPHIFYKHDGTPEVGRSTNHGQTKGYRWNLAGKSGMGGNPHKTWPVLDTVISTANSKASTVAATLGEEVTHERELELEEEAKVKAKEKLEQEQLEKQKLAKGAWAALENDPSKDQSVVQWLQMLGLGPNEYRWFGDPSKGAERREQEELKHPELKKKVEEKPVEETTPVEEPKGEESTPESSDEPVVDESPTLDEPIVSTPTPTPKGGSPKPKANTPKPQNQQQPPKKGGKFKKKKKNNKKKKNR